MVPVQLPKCFARHCNNAQPATVPQIRAASLIAIADPDVRLHTLLRWDCPCLDLPGLDALQAHFACAKGRRNRKLPCSRISVIRAVSPTLLHTLLLHTLLPLEQEAPVDIAIQGPPPECRRQALGSGLIGAIAGIAELPTISEIKLVEEALRMS
jgi:hypothetical protein